MDELQHQLMKTQLLFASLQSQPTGFTLHVNEYRLFSTLRAHVGDLTCARLSVANTLFPTMTKGAVLHIQLVWKTCTTWCCSSNGLIWFLPLFEFTCHRTA